MFAPRLLIFGSMLYPSIAHTKATINSRLGHSKTSSQSSNDQNYRIESNPSSL
ncbi:unnamed protein product [Meloidogyne enterolobii]|uniref:Uncharacterized protein n=1 Tax=Meloidogyne enterolobii TaxID=390850 RepID=A0ACB0ZDS6_MELEN